MKWSVRVPAAVALGLWCGSPRGVVCERVAVVQAAAGGLAQTSPFAAAPENNARKVGGFVFATANASRASGEDAEWIERVCERSGSCPLVSISRRLEDEDSARAAVTEYAGATKAVAVHLEAAAMLRTGVAVMGAMAAMANPAVALAVAVVSFVLNSFAASTRSR